MKTKYYVFKAIKSKFDQIARLFKASRKLPDVLVVKEIKRAVDTFLITVECNSCKETTFGGLETVTECYECKKSFTGCVFDLSNAVKTNLVAIPDKKRRKGIGKKTVMKLLAMQDNCCAYCGKDVRQIEYHVDHITPLAAGGTSEFANLAVACTRCNLRCSSLYFRSFSEKQAYVISSILTKP